MHFLFGVFNHIQPIRRWARKHKATLDLSIDDFRLSIRLGDRVVNFIPKFLVQVSDGRAAYTSTFTDRCRFTGWLPYQLKKWPIATDKITFKQYCAARGLRATRHWTSGSPLSEHFIIKPRNGSFGSGMRGPFSIKDYETVKGSLPQNAYFEQFVSGRAAKIWFWNDEPRAMECVSPPHILGDGRRSLTELAGEVRGSFDTSHKLNTSEEMLAWQGYTADSVPKKGLRVFLDFRYATPYDQKELHNRDELPRQSEALREELRRIGRILMQTEGISTQTVFTLDAVLDQAGQLWLLEMNCNPIVHPNVYDAMLNDVFQVKDTTAGQTT
jgi:hypothetical protein